MTRHRARPSFTVEIKRTRNTPLTPSPDDAERQRAQALWKGTALAEMTAKAESLDAVFAPAPRLASAPARPAKVAPLGRRVLPSLIPAPEVEVPEPTLEEPEPEIAPVVRRRRSASPRPTVLTLVMEADEASAASPDVSLEDLMPAATEPDAESAPADALAAAQRPARGYAARAKVAAKTALRPGERWKRRLPRVCW